MFIWDEIYENGDFSPETVIAVDVADPQMMLGLYDEFFASAKHTVCIDHHGTNSGYADVNCILSDAAAAGEIVFQIIEELGVCIDKKIAERIFVAIADDTGGFQYSNTTAQTHRIVSELYGASIKSDEIMRLLFATLCHLILLDYHILLLYRQFC